MDECGQRRQRSVAYYWPGAREALIVEPLRGTPLPIRATPFSRRFPWCHSRVSDILRRDTCIPSTLAWRRSQLVNAVDTYVVPWTERIAGNGHSFCGRRARSHLKERARQHTPEPFYVLSLLDEQPSSREHDPCDERGQAGEQQELIQYSGGHGTLPRTAPPQAPYASALPYLGQMVAAPTSDSHET
jgi:hypothetical protein